MCVGPGKAPADEILKKRLLQIRRVTRAIEDEVGRQYLGQPRRLSATSKPSPRRTPSVTRPCTIVA